MRPGAIGAWLLLLVPNLARAQAICSERLEPDGFRERVAQLGAAAAGGDEALGEQLDDLEELAESCIDGPIAAVDLAELFMAEALWETRREAGDPRRVQERLTWAAALAGEAALRPEHEALREPFQAALAAASQRGTLDLDFHPVPAVLVVDGQVEYELGPREVPAGAHLIQWLDEGVWTGRIVTVEAGRSRSLSVGEPPPESAAIDSTGSMGTIDAGSSRPEVLDQWLGGALSLQRYTAAISDGRQVWEAAAVAPGGGVDGRYQVLEWLSVGGRAAFAPEGDEANPAVLTRARLELGLGWGSFFRADLLLGGELAPRPTAAPSAGPADSPPTFEESPSAGPSLRLRGAAGDAWRISLSAGGALLGPATELSGDLAVSWRGGPLDPVAPRLRITGGQLTQPGLGGVDDRYRWIGGELGARWLF